MKIKLTDKEKIRVSEPEDIYGIMQRVLLRDNKIDREKEHFWVVGLNQAGYILSIELVSLGASAMTVVEPMNVFRLAIMKGAARIVAVNNHPDGVMKASEREEDITDRLIQVGRIIDVQLDDHLIITPLSYLSFKQTGLMDKLAESIKYVPTYQLIERIRNEEKAIREEMTKELLKEQEAHAKALEAKAEAQEAQENERQEKTRAQLALAQAELALLQEQREKILVKKRLARSLYSKGIGLPDIAEMMLITIKDVEDLLKL